MLRELNRTSIVLVPKVKNPEEVSQFRPISCCNFGYKIISKVLVNKMQGYMGELITQEQSAFLKGRQIQDNILVAGEVFHYLKLRKRGRKYEMALKIDTNKAYDRVEWDFVKEVMERLGFSRKWVMWVMECLSSVSFNTIVNGKSSKSFNQLEV